MIVAIDGPAGSGKSTVAKALAERLGFTMLDTGAMYRAVTLACIRSNTDCSDEDAVRRVAAGVCIEFKNDEEGTQHVLLDGDDVTQAIRTPEVDKEVSRVSAIPEVYPPSRSGQQHDTSYPSHFAKDPKICPRLEASRRR